MSNNSDNFFVVYRKYEEIYPPDVGEFAYITDDTYTKSQVLLAKWYFCFVKV